MPFISPSWIDKEYYNDDLASRSNILCTDLNPRKESYPYIYSRATPPFPGASSIDSRYWKVSGSRLTCIDTHATEPLVAIGLRSSQSNLLIYEHTHVHAERSVLTHHQSITLPNTFIGRICWVPRHVYRSGHSQLLATGHMSSINLIKLSDPYSSSDPAKIVVNLSHNGHRKQRRLAAMAFKRSQPSLVTLAGGRFFEWDLEYVKHSHEAVLDIRTHKLSGITTFDVAATDDNIIVTGGYNGISIRDLRSVVCGLSPKSTSNVSQVSHCTWSPTNSYLIASASRDNIVRVWDVRSVAPVYEFSGHKDDIMSVRWNNTGSGLVTASLDGSIRSWMLDDADVSVGSKFSMLPTSLPESPHTSAVPPVPALDFSSPTSMTTASSSYSNGTPRSSQTHYRTVSNSTCDSTISTSSAYSSSSSRWRVFNQRLSTADQEQDLGYFVDHSSAQLSSAVIYAPEKRFVDVALTSSPAASNEIMSIDTDGFLGVHLDKATNPHVQII